MNRIPPVQREVVVDLEPDRAFQVFTDKIGEWWPLGDFGVFGAGASVVVREGMIVESLGDKTAVWGTVTEWEPPSRLAFTWHPGKDPGTASAVSVSFEPVGGGTRVLLEHTGWEVFSDPAGARDEYDHGWPAVLARYSELANRAG